MNEFEGRRHRLFAFGASPGDERHVLGVYIGRTRRFFGCWAASGDDRVSAAKNAAHLTARLPVDAPNRWVDSRCRYCSPGAPCVMHDRRPKTLAQNRVLFGECFGYEPTADDYREAGW